MDPYLSVFHSSVSRCCLLFLFALCWRIRNASSAASSTVVQPGLSHAQVPPHQSLQYSPRDVSVEQAPKVADGAATPRRPKLDPAMLQLVKSHFGNVFGLKDRPRAPAERAKLHIPEVMLQMYRDSLPADQRVTETEAEIVARLKARRRKPSTAASTASMVRSFLHEEPTNPPKDRETGLSEDIHKEHIFFDTQSIPPDDEIKAAELQVFVEQNWSVPSLDIPLIPASTTTPSILPLSNATSSASSNNHQRLLIRVDEVLSRTADGEAITRPLDSRLVDVRKKSKYVIFDITPAVQRWQGLPTENHGLEVVFMTPDGYPLAREFLSQDPLHFDLVTPMRRKRVRRAADPTSRTTTATEWTNPAQEQHPLALVYSDDAKTARAKTDRAKTRGQTRTQARPLRQNQCRRWPLNVDFTDIGWNEWILAPPNYNAYFCMGDCHFPLADHLNTTNHATVQSLVHNANIQSVARPCCVPTDLSPISLLYMDEYEKIVLKNYQDMVIEGCGCR